ncbi:unnamed protein product [Protopolystoma xenopodis]|uniref:Uncharacterized protein n=1 Tax=Protopolystoma xenopodis TaxID=117903 RepID=A0A3S5CIU5_9PLAT|nr:unnamed protein product [Protopolystoma xenopodis]
MLGRRRFRGQSLKRRNPNEPRPTRAHVWRDGQKKVIDWQKARSIWHKNPYQGVVYSSCLFTSIECEDETELLALVTSRSYPNFRTSADRQKGAGCNSASCGGC